jgi:Rrf2 family iron-sulfur cluster assembly transcriptional regulator
MLEHMSTITLKSLVDEQIAGGVAVEARPARRAISARSPVTPLRTTAPNSVFALARSMVR